MVKITLTLGKSIYPIAIASGLFGDSTAFVPLKTGDQAMLVTNQTLAPLYLDSLRVILALSGVKVDQIILPDGEQYKSLVVLE